MEAVIGVRSPAGVANLVSVKKGQARPRRVLLRAIAASAAPSNAQFNAVHIVTRSIERFEQAVSIAVLQLHLVLISTG